MPPPCCTDCTLISDQLDCAIEETVMTPVIGHYMPSCCTVKCSAFWSHTRETGIPLPLSAPRAYVACPLTRHRRPPPPRRRASAAVAPAPDCTAPPHRLVVSCCHWAGRVAVVPFSPPPCRRHPLRGTLSPCPFAEPHPGGPLPPHHRACGRCAGRRRGGAGRPSSREHGGARRAQLTRGRVTWARTVPTRRHGRR